MKTTSKKNNIFSLSMVQQIIHYIEQNILENLSPAVIAAHFYISVSVLSSLFKIACDMTVMEYIRNRRLSLAAEDLTASDIPIIELALKYGYETPEAFTKAFARFHGFPPSFIRRGFPVTKFFAPIQIDINIQGGWDTTDLTKLSNIEQELSLSIDYNTIIGIQDQICTDNQASKYQIKTDHMQYKKDWKVLYSLCTALLQNHIPFKIDGKTMIFAHGIEIPIDKICLTFQWNDEEKIKKFFHYDSVLKYPENGFKYFDTSFENAKIRCMFYDNCLSDHTDAFLYRNADLVQIDDLIVPVQSLKFYYENAEINSDYYKKVEDYLKKYERL